MARFEEILLALKTALAAESSKYYRIYNPVNHRKNRCSALGCPNHAYAKNLCNAHYLRNKKGKSFDLPLRCRKRIHSEPCASCGTATNNKGGWHLCTKCFRTKRRSVLKTALVIIFGGLCGKCSLPFPACVFDFHHTGIKT